MNKESLNLVKKYGYPDPSLTGMKLITIQALHELGKGLSMTNTLKLFGIKKLLCPECSQKSEPTALMLDSKKALFCPNCIKVFSSKAIVTMQKERK